MSQAKKTRVSRKDSQSDANSKGGKSSITKEIDKLMNRIGSANENIKQTEKLLDVDLFLKQQKQKRMEYAKTITADFEAQKKIREEKLYKKHNR